MTTPVAASAAKEAGVAAVEVGKIFGQSADGLILYALLLGTFLMFIVAVGAVWLSFRAINQQRISTADSFAKKDELNNDQTKAFIASANKLGDAVNALAISAATQTTVQAGQTQVLSRLESTNNRLEDLLRDLGGVDFVRRDPAA